MVTGGHAIVVGAGMAGLCAARALADTFDQVTVLDRDALPGHVQARARVPQGRHVHAVLGSGAKAFRELFPGLIDGLTVDGVRAGDSLADARTYVGGTRLRPARGGLEAICVARPELEFRIRERLAALANVTIVAGTTVVGLTGSLDRATVTGVRTRSGGTSDREQERPADLVVDASGRNSVASAWLGELGYAEPPELRVEVDLAYSSCAVTMPDDVIDGDLGVLVIPTPDNPRGGGIVDLGDRGWLVSLFGYHGDHPPLTFDEIIAFARSLAVPDLYLALRRATAAGEPVRFRFPSAFRRRYDQLRRFPEGLVVLGDAVCSFNPIYGQGMSVAALEALELRDHLRRTGLRHYRAMRRRIARVSGAAWTTSVNNDLRMPWIEGRRTVLVRVGNAYMTMLYRVVGKDHRVARAFMRVANLVDPPSALIRPSIVWLILVGNVPSLLRRRAGTSGGAAAPGT